MGLKDLFKRSKTTSRKTTSNKKPTKTKPTSRSSKPKTTSNKKAPATTKSKGNQKEQSLDKKRGETFPHFRKHLKANHPALIVGEKSKEEYTYRKVMHGEKDGRHLNEEVRPNPNKKDKKPMYIAKRVRHDPKEKFSTWTYPWEYPKK